MSDGIGSVQAQNALMTAQKAPRFSNKMNIEKARSVSQDFEAFFLSQMLQPMFSEVKPAEPFGGGPAEGMWRTMQVNEYGKAIARSGGIGIADAVFKEMIKLQEGS